MEQDEYTVFAMVESGKCPACGLALSSLTPFETIICIVTFHSFFYHFAIGAKLLYSYSIAFDFNLLLLRDPFKPRDKILHDCIYSFSLWLSIYLSWVSFTFTVIPFADNEYARLKREEYVMDVVTEMRLQSKECVIVFERTSWFFSLRLESATYDYLDMMYSQCIPDYIDGYLLTLDYNNKIPPRQLVC